MRMQDQVISEGKDGLSQSDRLLWMLLPENVAIDNRNPAALMLRAARLAEQFTYYNFSNEPDGNWQDFFLSEFNIIILMIPALDFAPRIRAYEKQVAELRLAADKVSVQERRKGLTNAVAGLADVLKSLLERLNAVTPPTNISARVNDSLTSVLSIQKLVGALKVSAPTEAAVTRQEQTLYLVDNLHQCFSKL